VSGGAAIEPTMGLSMLASGGSLAGAWPWLVGPPALSGRERIARGNGRHPVAGEVECDAAEVIPQRDDDLPVEEGRCRVAVQEQERLARPLVHVVDARAVKICETMLDWKQLVRYGERQDRSTAWRLPTVVLKRLVHNLILKRMVRNVNGRSIWDGRRVMTGRPYC